MNLFFRLSIKRFAPQRFLAGFLIASMLLSFAPAPARAIIYQPGETLNPACAPTDPNCAVAPLLTASNASNVNFGPTAATAGSTAELRFQELAANGANYTGFKSPDTLAANVLYTLPAADGAVGQVLSTNASGALSWATPAGGGLGSLNGLAAPTQTFTAGATGTDFNISSSGSVHTFNIPNSSATARGLLTSADWSAFNSKLASTLANGQIFIGNVSNTAIGTAMSGDAAISNTGALTISSNAVTLAKLAVDAVNSAKIIDGSIGLADLADGSVDTAKIVDATITNADVSVTAAILYSKLALGNSVVLSDLTADSVNGSKIIDGSIVAADLATDAVTSAKILDGTIADSDVAATAAIALSKIAGGSNVITSLAAPTGSNANGGSIAGNVLSLSLADGTNPGLVSTGAQTIAGAKTFSAVPTLSTMTAGSLLFTGAGGLVSQDNASLFWDDANNRLGIGTAAPAAKLAVNATASENPLSVGGQLNVSVFPGYAYRAPITVTAAGALANYQTSIVVNTAALVTAGKMQSNGNDIRITASDGATLQNYWIETGTMNTATTRIWFKAASLASGANTFYLYYGNPSATAASNGDNVFVFFDDFNGSAVDAAKWIVDDSTGVSVSGGSLAATNSNGKLRSQWSYAGTPVIQETQGIITTDFTAPYNVTYGGFWASGSDGVTFIRYRLALMPESEDGYFMPENILPYGNVSSVPIGTEFLSRASVVSGTQVAAQTINYSTGGMVNDQTITNTVSNGEKILLVRSGNDASFNATGNMSIRFARVRAYAASEPTTSTGAEGATPTTSTPSTFLTVNSSGNVLPGSDNNYSLGSATNRWKDLYLAGATLYIGDQSLSNSGGSLTWSGSSIQAAPSATSSTEMRLSELSGNGANYTGFKAPDALAANILYTLPSADAAGGGQMLSSNGAGVLSWATPAAGGVASLAAPTGSNANGGSISGSVLTLSLADGTNPGLVSTATQTIAGAKTFSAAPTLSTMTAGSLLFTGAGGLASQDNASLFWDDANNRLGIGTSAPSAALDVAATAKAVSFNASSSTAPFQINGSTVLNIGNGTTFVGNEAGKNNQATAYSATFVGHYAGRNNTTGTLNTAVGGGAFSVNTIGSSNTAIGALSLTANTTGYSNAALGAQTLMSNTIGTNNTAIGTGVLAFNIEGVGNTAVGSGSALLATGNNNTASGVNTGVNLTTGNNNSLYGYQAGDNITSGSNNLIIGYNIDAPLATGNNQLSIGNLIFGTGIDGTGTTVSTGNIGIGTSNPISKLHIVPSTAAALQIDPYGAGAGNTGDLRLQELAANGANYTGFKSPDSLAANVLYTLPAADATASGQVLSSNATGALSWITPASGSSAGGTGAIQFASGISFAADAANLFWDDTNNRLGIGTATPATKLAVAGGDVSVMSAPPSFSATGGTITTSGGYTIHTFTSSGIFTVTGSGTVDVLAVAGGAGGGGGTSNAGGAGGGAGGVVYATSQTVATGSITVTVGTGGAGGGANTNGSNGGNSSFGAIMATGGGGGGSNNNNGSNGGSGGGGGFSKTGGTGMAGQGNNGGNGGSSTFGAGGGAGGVGGNAGGNGGNGGPGVSNSISGTATTYAGGGAGSYYDFPPSCTGPYNGAGGSGGGGNVCVNGTNGLGGGGGGAGVANSAGPNGGSGIIIVRYLTPSNTGGNVGIGTIIPSQLLEIVRSTDGIVARFTDANGSCDVNPTSTALICSSDERLKKNIITIDPTLEKMLALNPITFNWNKEGDEAEKHLGFIAQDVEKLFPSLVSTNEDGFKAIAYGNFTPLIVKALQEQQFEIAGLTGSNALAFADANNIGADENRITDPVAYITDKINMGIKIAKELVAERIVAVQGYFKRIFANELCLTDSSGALVCVTGDNLKNIGGTAENFQFPISNFQSSFNGLNPNIEVPIASPPVETPAPELSPIASNEFVLAETPISSADGGAIPNQSAGADATGQAGQASIAPLSTVESSESILSEPAVQPSGTAITAATPAEAESAAVENAANNSAQRQSGQIN